MGVGTAFFGGLSESLPEVALIKRKSTTESFPQPVSGGTYRTEQPLLCLGRTMYKWVVPIWRGGTNIFQHNVIPLREDLAEVPLLHGG